MAELWPQKRIPVYVIIGQISIFFNKTKFIRLVLSPYHCT